MHCALKGLINQAPTGILQSSPVWGLGESFVRGRGQWHRRPHLWKPLAPFPKNLI